MTPWSIDPLAMFPLSVIFVSSQQLLYKVEVLEQVGGIRYFLVRSKVEVEVEVLSYLFLATNC